MMLNLNARALGLVDALIARAAERRVAVYGPDLLEPDRGAPAGMVGSVDPAREGRVIDCGILARGGLLAGLDLARICLAGLAEVAIVPGSVGGRPCPAVQVLTDHPVDACLASQYAGWHVTAEHYFAMGSGPMRAANVAREAIFAKIGRPRREEAPAVVGVLEGRKPPTPAVLARIAESCGVAPAAVTLLIAPTASLAGGVQVVARSVETALHKLAEVGFDLSRLVSAHGTAPLPPVAADDLGAIGRTNDAILYGARVVLCVTGDDASIEEVGAKVPSSASHDHGEPFAAIFARYNHDFYAVDPHLFSPAEVVFQNLDTGRVHAFGQVAEDVMVRSFYQ